MAVLAKIKLPLTDEVLMKIIHGTEGLQLVLDFVPMLRAAFNDRYSPPPTEAGNE